MNNTKTYLILILIGCVSGKIYSYNSQANIPLVILNEQETNRSIIELRGIALQSMEKLYLSYEEEVRKNYSPHIEITEKKGLMNMNVGT